MRNASLEIRELAGLYDPVLRLDEQKAHQRLKPSRLHPPIAALDVAHYRSGKATDARGTRSRSVLAPCATDEKSGIRGLIDRFDRAREQQIPS